MLIHDAFHVGHGQVQGYQALWGQPATKKPEVEPIPAGSYVILEQEGDIFRIAPINEPTQGLALAAAEQSHSYYVKMQELNGVGVDGRLMPGEGQLSSRP